MSATLTWILALTLLMVSNDSPSMMVLLEDKMKHGLFLDVVIGKGTAILELLSSKDEILSV